MKTMDYVEFAEDIKNMKNKYIYKIDELPKDMNLVGCKLNGKIIISGWCKGFWVRKEKGSSEVLPVFFKDFDDIKNWKVEVPEEKIIELMLNRGKIIE